MQRRVVLRGLAGVGLGATGFQTAGCGSGTGLAGLVDVALGLLGLYSRAAAFTPAGLLIDAALLLFGQQVAAQTPLNLSFNRNHQVIFTALTGASPLTIVGTYAAGALAGQLQVELEESGRSFLVNSVSDGEQLTWTWVDDAPTLTGEGVIAAESRVVWTR